MKNGKYFVAPEQNNENFKTLFARLAAAGAGRPVDAEGFPDGPWTPETLTDAICTIPANTGDINVRAVQVWFQDNDNGIGIDNIRWLARIFGCGDPEAASVWQAELSAAKDRLTAERKAKRDLPEIQEPNLSERLDQPESKIVPHAISATAPSIEKPTAKTLAERTEWILSGSASVNLIVTYWLILCGLGYLNFVMGTISVTYSPYEGLDKQVGFLWAPTLTILPLVALPAYIYYVSDLNTYWKRIGRSKCTSQDVSKIYVHNNVAWLSKVNNFSFSFWTIALFCFLFVCCFQWFGIYLPAYLSGDTNGVQIDRYLVTLERPEVISIPQAMVLSAIGYLYTASYIAIFMFGLLFLVIIVYDYHDICTTLDLENAIIDGPQIRREGQKIVWGSFRIAVFGLWLAILLKLQVTYLSSDAKDTLTWLWNDALAVFNKAESENGWLENTSITHFTTFLMVVVTVTIFVVAILKVKSIFDRFVLYDEKYPFARDRGATTKMLLVVALLSVTLITVGRFDGFSLMLVLGTVASLHVLAGPKLRNF